MNFPSSPTTGQIYTYEGKSWRYNGVGWALYVRPQLDLDGSTVLTLNAEHYDTFATDVTFTLSGTPVAKDVIFVNAIVTDVTGTSMTFDFGAGVRRVGSEGLISALLAPEGNHSFVLKYIGGEWWLSDSFGTVTETTYVVPTVATPTFNPVAGEVEDNDTVVISTVTSGATIRYTVDGSTPSVSVGTIYTTAIVITDAVTIKAIAYKTGSTTSSVATAAYTVAVTGTASATDTFEALSSGVLLSTGGNWAGVGTNKQTIVDHSGDASVYPDDSADTGARYTTTTFTANHSSTITIFISGSPSGGIGPAVRMQSGTDTYYFAYYDKATNLVYLYKRNGGTNTQIGSTVSRTYTSSDTLTLSVTGTGTETRLTVTDDEGAVFSSVNPGATYIDGGQPGIWGYGTNPGLSISSWAGEDI